MQKKLKYISWFLVMIWMIFIFVFSNQSGTDSTETSGSILQYVQDIMSHIFPNGNSDIYVWILRKGAHMTEYMILGILVYNACLKSNVKSIFIFALLICMIYACSDEIHQLFIPGRAGMIQDVCIDTIGSILGISGMHICLRKKIV